MSKVMITCPSCTNTQSFQVHDFLENDQRNNVQNQILSGELFTFECDHCHFKSPIIYPLFYYDRHLNFLLYLLPAGEKENEKLLKEKIRPLLLEKPDILTREVHNDKELMEKILIFNFELDDRIVEMVKAEANHFMKDQEPDIMIHSIYLNRDKSGFFLTLFLQDNTQITLEVDPQVFEIADKKYSETISKQNEYRFMSINDEWSKTLLEMYQKSLP